MCLTHCVRTSWTFCQIYTPSARQSHNRRRTCNNHNRMETHVLMRVYASTAMVVIMVAALGHPAESANNTVFVIAPTVSVNANQIPYSFSLAWPTGQPNSYSVAALTLPAGSFYATATGIIGYNRPADDGCGGRWSGWYGLRDNQILTGGDTYGCFTRRYVCVNTFGHCYGKGCHALSVPASTRSAH